MHNPVYFRVILAWLRRWG